MILLFYIKELKIGFFLQIFKKSFKITNEELREKELHFCSNT